MSEPDRAPTTARRSEPASVSRLVVLPPQAVVAAGGGLVWLPEPCDWCQEIARKKEAEA